MSETVMSEPKIICKGCKAETSPGLFENPENLRINKEVLGELGFTADPTFIEFIKERTVGLCALCGEIEIVKLALMAVMVDETEGETRECMLKLLNALTCLAEESVWIECKRAVIDEIASSRLGCRASWRLFMRLCNMRGQPQHVSSAEAGLMRDLRKRGYSLGDLAFIFDRSKETIHRHIGEEAFR